MQHNDTLPDPIRSALHGNKRAAELIASGSLPYSSPGRLSWNHTMTDCEPIERADPEDPWMPVRPEFDSEPWDEAYTFLKRYGFLDAEGIEESDPDLAEHAYRAWEEHPPEILGAYVWPMRSVDDPNAAAILIHRWTNCALIETSESYGIATTACGMDLSHDIALAFILAGFYPPVSLRLPMMAGMLDSEYGPNRLACLCLAEAQIETGRNLERAAMRHAEMAGEVSE